MSTRPANDLGDVQPDGFFTRKLADADSAVAEAIEAGLPLVAAQARQSRFRASQGRPESRPYRI